jgi:hypothetical protein
MKRIDERDIERFQELTRAALNETDPAKFVERLLQREKMTVKIAEFSPALEKDVAERLYGNEMLVIERLEAERSQLFAEIELYARSEKAMRSYRSKFPIPPVRPFF